MRVNSVILIKNKAKCTGCTACASICPPKAISFSMDEEGFSYPVADEQKCIRCGLCEKVCPINSTIKITNQPIAYAAYSTDKNVLEESSSGGVFYHLAKQYIGSGGIVYGATLTDKMEVKHIGIEKIEDISKIMGSKYVQSSLGNTFFKVKEDLQKGRAVMFVGTPCQTEGLLSFLGGSNHYLMTVDFACHGVPSPKVFCNYVSELGRKHRKQVCDVRFRSKTISWREFSFVARFSDNTELSEKFTNNTYMKGFVNNLFLRPSCHRCQFKTVHRRSDITIADFWGVQNIIPNINMQKGVSLCCVNSLRGKALFDDIKGDVFTQEVSFDEAVQYNAAYTEAVKANGMRKWFFEHMNSVPVIKNIEQSLRPNYITRIILKLRKRKYQPEQWS